LEVALKRLGIYSVTHFSGRTDKSVHSSGQVVSCLIPCYWNDINMLKDKLNNMLVKSIRILSIHKEDKEFHARFSAKKRSYRYIISKKELTAFNSNYMAYKPSLNLEKIKNAAKVLIGIHDFEFFCKKGSEPHSTIREIYSIKIYQYKDIVVIKFNANSYLRSQIRMMVDFLFKISSNKLSIDDLKDQLNKKKASVLAPSFCKWIIS
jgi:tRNA pseudouridine38-40 synthase